MQTIYQIQTQTMSWKILQQIKQKMIDYQILKDWYFNGLISFVEWKTYNKYL